MASRSPYEERILQSYNSVTFGRPVPSSNRPGYTGSSGHTSSSGKSGSKSSKDEDIEEDPIDKDETDPGMDEEEGGEEEDDSVTPSSWNEIQARFRNIGKSDNSGVWFGDTEAEPTEFELVTRILKIGETDDERARELFADYEDLKRTPGNPLYSPYENGSTIGSFKEYWGVDEFTADWIKEHDYLDQFYVLDDKGNPVKPKSTRSSSADVAYRYAAAMGKKSLSDADKAYFKVRDKQELQQKYGHLESEAAIDPYTDKPVRPGGRTDPDAMDAYMYYNLKKILPLQEQVNTAWKNMQTEIQWLVDSGYSDADIQKKLQNNPEYKVLNELYAMATEGTPAPLLEKLTYSPDKVHGVIFAARNGQVVGDHRSDFTMETVRYYQSIEQQKASNLNPKDDPTSAEWMPNHRTTSAALNELGRRGITNVGLDGLTEDEFASLAWMRNDSELQPFYEAIYRDRNNTILAESQYAALRRQADDIIAKHDDPEMAANQLLNLLHNGYEQWDAQKGSAVRYHFDALLAVDDGRLVGKPVGLVRPFDYRAEDMAAYVRQGVEKRMLVERAAREDAGAVEEILRIEAENADPKDALQKSAVYGKGPLENLADVIDAAEPGEQKHGIWKAFEAVKDAAFRTWDGLWSVALADELEDDGQRTIGFGVKGSFELNQDRYDKALELFRAQDEDGFKAVMQGMSDEDLDRLDPALADAVQMEKTDRAIKRNLQSAAADARGVQFVVEWLDGQGQTEEANAIVREMQRLQPFDAAGWSALREKVNPNYGERIRAAMESGDMASAAKLQAEALRVYDKMTGEQTLVLYQTLAQIAPEDIRKDPGLLASVGELEAALSKAVFFLQYRPNMEGERSGFEELVDAVVFDGNLRELQDNQGIGFWQSAAYAAGLGANRFYQGAAKAGRWAYRKWHALFEWIPGMPEFEETFIGKGMDAGIDALEGQSTAAHQYLLENATPVEMVGVNVGSSVVNTAAGMMVGTAASYGTMGAWASAEIPRTLQEVFAMERALNFFKMSGYTLVSGGEAGYESEKRGENALTQVLLALTNGYITHTTEKYSMGTVIDRIMDGTKGGIHKALTQQGKSVLARWGKAGLEMLNQLAFGGLREGLQENTESVLKDTATYLIAGEDPVKGDWAGYGTKRLNEFFYSMISGAFMQAASFPSESRSARVVNQQLREGGKVTPQFFALFARAYAEDMQDAEIMEKAREIRQEQEVQILTGEKLANGALEAAVDPEVEDRRQGLAQELDKAKGELEEVTQRERSASEAARQAFDEFMSNPNDADAGKRYGESMSLATELLRRKTEREAGVAGLEAQVAEMDAQRKEALDKRLEEVRQESRAEVEASGEGRKASQEGTPFSAEIQQIQAELDAAETDAKRRAEENASALEAAHNEAVLAEERYNANPTPENEAAMDIPGSARQLAFSLGDAIVPRAYAQGEVDSNHAAGATDSNGQQLGYLGVASEDAGTSRTPVMSGSASGRDLDAARNEATLAEQRYAEDPTPENEAAMKAAFDKVNALMEEREQSGEGEEDSRGRQNQMEPDRGSDGESEGAGDLIDGIKITDGKVGGKIPVDDYKTIRQSSNKNSDADSITLGKFTSGSDSYIARAGQNSSYFDMGSEFDTIRKNYGLSSSEMFDYFNRPFLDDAISSGKAIRFSHDPRLYEKGFLVDEWEYLKSTLNLTDADLVFEGGFWNVRLK